MLEFLIIWPDSPALSLLIWLLVALLVLFAARMPVHRTIHGIAGAIGKTVRLARRALRRLEARVTERNREVLVSSALEAQERRIGREFSRIAAAVERNLGMYPTLHHTLSEQVRRVDEDYRRSSFGPPEPQPWATMMKTATDLARESDSEPAASRSIAAIHAGLRDAHREAMAEYRTTARARHRTLSKLVQVWRRMDRTLSRMEHTVDGIFDRSRHLDELVRGYAALAEGAQSAERPLALSALTRFVVAALALGVGVLAAALDFQLIALPLSQIVGEGGALVGFTLPQVAAAVIVLVQVVAGLFVMESLRITRMFSPVGRLDAPVRRRLAWTAFGFLLVFSVLGAVLAYARSALPGSAALLRPELAWAPATAQAVIALVLPLALTFVGVPLETLSHTTRVIAGSGLATALRFAAFVLHLVGVVAVEGGRTLRNVYDILIFLPLKIEASIVSGRRERSSDLVSRNSATPTT